MLNKKFYKKLIYINDFSVPMVGSLAFGIVDRGTNIIEVRPTTICGLSCIFCSVNAGPKSKVRWAEFIVSKDLLIDAVNEIVRYKDVNNIEVHIDGMGDPGNYKDLVELVQGIKSIASVKTISMQTRLYMLNEKKIKQLEEAGLDRFNVSIDSLDPILAKRLADNEIYEVSKVLELIDYTLKNTKIDVIISPVLLENINDEEIKKLVIWAYNSGLGKKWPPILIQKFIPHKRGRIPKGIHISNWKEFNEKLHNIEKELGYKLLFDSEVFNITRVRALPIVYDIGEKVDVKIIDRGIFKGEFLGAPINRSYSNIEDRVITVVAPSELEDSLVGSKVKVRIIDNNDNIYIARIQ